MANVIDFNSVRLNKSLDTGMQKLDSLPDEKSKGIWDYIYLLETVRQVTASKEEELVLFIKGYQDLELLSVTGDKVPLEGGVQQENDTTTLEDIMSTLMYYNPKNLVLQNTKQLDTILLYILHSVFGEDLTIRTW